MNVIRTLLIDDSSSFLGAAAGFLSGHPRMEVVGRASSGVEALQMIPTLHPDLILVDFQMPGMNGLEVTAKVKAMANAPSVIMLSLFDSNGIGALARKAGADGFVAKGNFVAELMPLILTLFDAQPAPAAESAAVTGFAGPPVKRQSSQAQ